ncbi:MAG: hypothetical protein FJX76_03395 [Armatimonadetes bacterium]|nr:hypothetical protein [Armatimonadota bacterium]
MNHTRSLQVPLYVLLLLYCHVARPSFGCDDPIEVVRKHFSALSMSEFSVAYKLLSKETRSTLPLPDYIRGVGTDFSLEERRALANSLIIANPRVGINSATVELLGSGPIPGRGVMRLILEGSAWKITL